MDEDVLGNPKEYRLFKRQEPEVAALAKHDHVKNAHIVRLAVDLYIEHRKGELLTSDRPHKPKTNSERPRK